MPDKVKGTAAPLCKLCGKRHWALCPQAYDPKGFIDRIPKKEHGRRIYARHTLETEHVADELDKDVKPKRRKKK